MIRANRRVYIAFAALALAMAAGSTYRDGVLRGFSGDSFAKIGEGRGKRGGGEVVMVTTATARTVDVPVTIDAVGTVQALNTATIRAQVGGRLIRVAFAEGQEVKKGDVLAEIDPALYRAQYDQAVATKAQHEANLANARVDLSRYEKLIAGKFLSHQQYATQKALVTQLEAQVRGGQAAVDNARTTLDYATIRSPIEGRVGVRLVDVGNILHSTDHTGIVIVTQIKPIHVVFTLPQQTLPAVLKAQSSGPAKVRALGPDNATALEDGELVAIDNQIDQLTATIKLKATFANDDLALWPGQFVNVRLTVDTLQRALVIPSAALQHGPNGAFVYVVSDDDTISLRTITTGQQDESQTVVTSGLEPDTKVVTNGFGRLMDGDRVRVASSTTENGGETRSRAKSASTKNANSLAAFELRGRKGN